jgi:hypothetical protein
MEFAAPEFELLEPGITGGFLAEEFRVEFHAAVLFHLAELKTSLFYYSITHLLSKKKIKIARSCETESQSLDRDYALDSGRL